MHDRTRGEETGQQSRHLGHTWHFPGRPADPIRVSFHPRGPQVVVTGQVPQPATASPAARIDPRPGPYTLLSGLAVAVLLVAVVGVTVGPVRLPVSQILGALGARLGLGSGDVDPIVSSIVLQLRLPRVILATLVGAALATSGAIFQGLFRNPMADPYIIGVSAGAALGATTAIVFGVTFAAGGLSAATMFAFVGAVAVTAIVYRLGWHRGDVVIEQLLLAGVAIGAFLGAVISAMQVLGGASLQQVLFWLLGGFSGRRWEHVLLILPYVVVGYIVAAAGARDLNLMVLGDETARSLGVATARVRIQLTAAGALMAAAAVATSGLIGFVGLIVPHLLRLVTGPDHRRLLPAAALGGAVTMLLADTLARTLAAPREIPVGIVTAGVGAPFFLYLLTKQRKRRFWS